MHVNPPDQAPRTASDQVTRVLTTLGLPTDDMNVRKRVETFIICNGYAGVQRAAQLTQRQMQRNPQLVADPWPYTVRVYNANAARLSYLYVLTHWAESGLRSQLNHYQLRALGETWHRFPANYLNGRQIHDFIQQTRWLITWDKPPGMPDQVARPATPTEFLEQISLGWLAKMVLFAHRKNARLILVHPIDGNTDYQRAESILKASEDARNAVAHNKYLSSPCHDDRRHATIPPRPHPRGHPGRDRKQLCSHQRARVPFAAYPTTCSSSPMAPSSPSAATNSTPGSAPTGVTRAATDVAAYVRRQAEQEVVLILGFQHMSLDALIGPHLIARLAHLGPRFAVLSDPSPM